MTSKHDGQPATEAVTRKISDTAGDFNNPYSRQEKIGSVLDLWKRSYGATKFMTIDKQANHRVMHQNGFGEANCLAG